jgi:transcriptional regulator with XRE-family HTH domain
MTTQALKNRVARIEKAVSVNHKNSAAFRAAQERQALIDRRKAAGMSQTNLARLARVSTSSVYNFENGRCLRPLVTQEIIKAYDRIIPTVSLGTEFPRRGSLDSAWLKKQTESFLRGNCLGAVEQKKIIHFVLSSDRVYDFGRTILLAAGINID